MLEIYVDADSCPVKDEIYRVAYRYALKVHVVANQSIAVPDSDAFRLVLVGGDIVITADILLAARCLEKSARVLGPRGRIFKDESIGEAIAAREAQAYMREMGIQAGGPKPLEERDRSNFLQKLDQVVQAVKRKA